MKYVNDVDSLNHIGELGQIHAPDLADSLPSL